MENAFLTVYFFKCHFQFFRKLREAPIKKNGKKGDIVPFSATPPPKRVKRGHFLSEKKSINRDKCVFATKQPMFKVLAIVEIPYYCGLPIPYPTH